jgi:hypothetical protein
MDIKDWLCSHSAEDIAELLRGLFMQGVTEALRNVEFDDPREAERIFEEIAKPVYHDETVLASLVEEEIQTIEAEKQEEAK